MSVRHGAAHDEGAPLVLDADNTDYYDETGLPPPHRLSSHVGHSPYAAASPRHSYIDPFSNARSTGSFDLDNPRASLHYPHADAAGMSHQPPSFSFANGGAPGSPSYGRLESSEPVQQWGRSESSTSLATGAQRDRYMQRRELEAGAAAGAGAAAVYGYGEKAGRSGAGPSRRKWWIIGGLVLLVVAVAGTVAGVMVSRNSSSSSKNVAGVVQTSDPNDPSSFSKNPALKQSFWGMCYTPLNSQYPACGDTLPQVIEDIQLVSQLTNRIRLYGADCNVPSYVLNAVKQTKVDMQVWLAVWVPQPADDPDDATYNRQVSEVRKAIEEFGVEHVAGITVGNEYLLNGGPADALITKMAAMRTMLAGMNLGKTIPVGTADAGSMVTTSLGAGSDYVMANVHPWFGGVPVDQSAGWVWSYMANHEPATARLAANVPQLYVAETGWPTGANETRLETLGPAVAGIEELNRFMSDYVCAANRNATAATPDPFSSYFFFEAFDEPWKDALYGGVEAHWGLFTSDKKLKEGLVIPDCS
ncbi:glycoside hydrolase [Tilletiopsis washingtonensis]|uniref:glucan endo-1,3-beta-D-glucosidase n=1 Tax=Tilletiopsis washingtonensis TaxID=58919 RepID=A0A316ZJG1_9BASI|nr:glycoside hydrolase [Tilletiopsis washingtonensis]PWO00414.1 glycoside hydrolase [Tilletiopsis washingtonensis]